MNEKGKTVTVFSFKYFFKLKKPALMGKKVGFFKWVQSEKTHWVFSTWAHFGGPWYLATNTIWHISRNVPNTRLDYSTSYLGMEIYYSFVYFKMHTYYTFSAITQHARLLIHQIFQVFFKKFHVTVLS